MEYRYSEEVDPAVYDTRGLANGIPLRIHKDPYKEINGVLRAQKDWSQHIRPVAGYKGCLGDRYSLIRLALPECLLERLEIISYANEFAFLYDDEMEKLDLKSNAEGSLEFLNVFGDGALNHKVESNTGPEKKLQAQILLEMMAIDSERAITSMNAWAKFVQVASRTRLQLFDTLEEYLPRRMMDVGQLFWFGILTFGMAITIREEEIDFCMELARPGYAAITLTNDLYSWKKEREAAERDGLDYVFNAIWVIMRERSVGEEEAMAVCADEIKRYIAEYCHIVEETKKNLGLSRGLRAYIEAVMYTYIGNLVWSISCPRYHDTF